MPQNPPVPTVEWIESQIRRRENCRRIKDYCQADEIRNLLLQWIFIEDGSDGTTRWRWTPRTQEMIRLEKQRMNEFRRRWL